MNQTARKWDKIGDAIREDGSLFRNRPTFLSWNSSSTGAFLGGGFDAAELREIADWIDERRSTSKMKKET